MNKILTLLSLLAILLTASCSGSQKPAERERTKTVQKTDSVVVGRVAFERENPYDQASTPRINVELNGVPFKMLWDTGAEGSTISKLELAALAKAGKISDADYEGYVRAVVADGSSVKVPQVRIRELVIRGKKGEEFTVYNVTMSVMPTAWASMLLGQNVMKELPRCSVVDNEQEIVFYQDDEL